MLVVYNVISIFSSYRNVFIFDLQDDIKQISLKEPNAHFFVEGKEYLRISSVVDPGKRQLIQDDLKSFNELYDIYALWDKRAYYCISDNKHKNSQKNKTQLNAIGFKKIRRYLTNKQKNKTFSIYFYPPQPPPACDSFTEYSKDGILRAYIQEYDVFIYQINNKLVWLVGTDLDPKTEFLYFLYTDDINLLPEHRIKHGYDNRGFRIENYKKEEYVGKYRVFSKEIPAEYPITSIKVGFCINNVRTGVRLIDFSTSE